jgi:hypothetical protein
MKKVGRNLVAAGLLVVAASAAASAVKVERLEIVDDAIEFHGGRLFRHSLINLELCAKSGCYSVEAAVNGGYFDYRVGGTVRGEHRVVRATNDELELWLDGVAMPIPEGRETGLRDWVMERVYFCCLPHRLNDESVFKEDLGREVWQGKELRKVKVTFAAGSSTDAADEYLYWFDETTGRLEQFAYSFHGSPGGLRFRRAFNYRRVGGILFFDQENYGVAGDELQVEQITPDFVHSMQRVSTILLKNIAVAPLAD